MKRKRHARKALVLTDGTTNGGNCVEPMLKLGDQLADLYGPSSVNHIYIEHDD